VRLGCAASHPCNILRKTCLSHNNADSSAAHARCVHKASGSDLRHSGLSIQMHARRSRMLCVAVSDFRHGRRVAHRPLSHQNWDASTTRHRDCRDTSATLCTCRRPRHWATHVKALIWIPYTARCSSGKATDRAEQRLRLRKAVSQAYELCNSTCSNVVKFRQR
jgi:hypothetical protein